ncbi:MAG: histidine phosphatase family protein [Devosia sp.]|nr:histidine phosphatase family protein [Devosia sp.]
MVRLLLLRHAKALRDGGAATDADRPLAPEGVAAAAAMGAAMHKAGYLPERILCSPARRTRETLLGILPGLLLGLPENAEIAFVPGLYDGSAAACADLVRTLGGQASPLLLVGHNPAIEELARAFAGSGAADLRQALAAKFPTAALAVVDFAGGAWSEMAPGTGRLVDFVVPAG